MTHQATARGRRLLWLLVALAAGLNGCANKTCEPASDTVTAVVTPAPTEVLHRAALTRAFREQATEAAGRTRADVTAELAERMERGRSTLLALADPRKRG